MKIRKSPI